MQQTLFYISGELFGLPTFGFGLVLAIWAVVSVLMLAWLAYRQGLNADTIGYAQVLGVVGIGIAFVLPALCDPRGLPIRGYGMMMLLAVLSGMGLAAYRARRVGVDPEMIFTLAFWMIIPGILGARAVYVTEYWADQYWPVYLAKGMPALLFAVVNVAAGGLVVYGSFVGGMIGLGLFWWRYRIPLLATADLIAPSMLLGLALGRVGCMLNGCCYGGPCDLPWKVTFPWSSPVHQDEVEKDIADIAGLKFRDGPNDRPIIESVAPDSPAGRAGLMAGLEIQSINGVEVNSAKEARQVALGIDKLDFRIADASGNHISWTVDDPPMEEADRVKLVKIFGLEVAGMSKTPSVITAVRRPSPEYSAGIRPGQRIESVSGEPVTTILRLRQLIDQHRYQPWLIFGVTGREQPVCVNVDRPLPRSLPVHPTQLYSTIDALILCFLLLTYDRFRRRDGELTALMMSVYPITRFLTESIRTDEAAIWGTPFTISQNISLCILAIAIGLWIYVLRRPAKLAFG